MWQEIAIIIIGLLVIFYIGRKIYNFITRTPDTPCDNCPGCALKDIKKKS